MVLIFGNWNLLLRSKNLETIRCIGSTNSVAGIDFAVDTSKVDTKSVVVMKVVHLTATVITVVAYESSAFSDSQNIA